MLRLRSSVCMMTGSGRMRATIGTTNLASADFGPQAETHRIGQEGGCGENRR
jgi:hypothetical protein